MSDAGDPQNPYAVSPDTAGTIAAPLVRHYGPPSKGMRFIGFVIDSWFGAIVWSAGWLVLLGVVLSRFGVEFEDGGGDPLEGPVGTLVTLVFYCSYYVTFEYLTGRTLGKLISGTRVVGVDGRPPRLDAIVGRSLIRIVPFDQFSIFGDDDRMWHDSWSGTRVVRTRPNEFERLASSGP